MRQVVVIVTALIVLGSRVADAQETCGDLIDNDSDGLADEQCNPAAVTGVCESPVSCGTSGAVAPRTGQLVYNEPADIAPRVPFGPPLALSRNYASLAADQTGYRGSLGKGWRHTFMGWLELNTTPNPDEAIVRLVSGQEVLFEYTGEDGTSSYDLYAPQPGYHVDTLRRHQTSDVWELITLEGWTYEYDDSSCGGLRMLVRIEDPFGQGLTLAYDGSCYLQTVTDADGERQLAFTYDGNNKLDKVDFKIASTTRVTVQYTVTSDKLEDVTVGSTLVRDYTWTGNKLDLIEDGGAKNVADFTYLNATPGKVARIKTADGHLGYRYGDNSCDGGEGLYLYYNDTDDTDVGCDSDSDCGTDNYCGGEMTPGTGNTGVCFRARRCVSISASHDDVIDSVASAATCTTCVDTKSYVWDTSPSLDLVSTESADSAWTHYDRNADGLVTRVIEGDDDSNPATIPAGARVTWFYYHSTFRGRVTEVRRMTELGPAQGGGSCDSGTNTTDCKRTLYSYQATSGNGAALTSVEEDGWTYVPDAMSGYARQTYAYTTTYDYDNNGRLEAIFGPRGSVYDDVTFTYWSSSDPLKDGMLHQTTRALGASTGLTTTFDDYDYWGNAKSSQDPNGNYTCRTFHADLDIMTVNRVAMNNQTSCATSNTADLVTSTTYDTSKRVTRIEKSLGNCVYRAYDAWGRLLTVKERDDCLTASLANTMELTYNDDGLVIKTEYKDTADAVTYRRETTYGRDRRLYEIVNPTQTTKKKTLAYLADGMLDSITGEDGVGKTQWTYDARNRADVEKRYLDGSTTDDWGITNCLQMDRIFDVSDEDGKSLERTWDDMRRNVKQVTPDGGTSLFFYDAAGNRTKHVEGFNSADEKTHEFTYDAQNRILTENYGDAACFTNGGAEIQYTYDTPPGCPGGSCPCPTGTCVNSAGRLAFVKVKVACDDARSDDTFDQITYIGYDDVGRPVKETIQDDGGRNVTQNYNWDENGNLILVEAPSGIDMKWTYGSGSSNVDADRVVSVVFDTGSGDTTLVSNGLWYPFGPIKQYEQANTVLSNNILARFTHDLAYRPTELLWEQENSGTDLFKIAHSHDAQGRITARDFSAAPTGVSDAWYLYDWQDRVTCDSTVDPSGSCPTQSGQRRNHLTGSPPYTASSDRQAIFHETPNVYAGTTYTSTYLTGSDQLDKIVKSSDPTGEIDFGWDGRGNRLYDDDDEWTDDRRDYTYDARNNLVTVSGKMKISATVVHDYTVVNGFDHRNRRFFKSLLDETTSVEAHWFYYYDPSDRLIEVRYTPDISVSSSYQLIQFYWIGDRPVARLQTTYQNQTATQARRFLHADHLNTPLDAWTWPIGSGDSGRVWGWNPDAFGWGAVVQGADNYIPLRFPGQMEDEETTAWHYNAGTSDYRRARPPLSDNRFRAYDPFTASYLQVDPDVASGWNAYSYRKSNPDTSPQESEASAESKAEASLATALTPNSVPEGKAGCWYTITYQHFGPYTSTVCSRPKFTLSAISQLSLAARIRYTSPAQTTDFGCSELASEKWGTVVCDTSCEEGVEPTCNFEYGGIWAAAFDPDNAIIVNVLPHKCVGSGAICSEDDIEPTVP